MRDGETRGGKEEDGEEATDCARISSCTPYGSVSKTSMG